MEKRTKQGAGSDVTSPSLAQRHAVVQPPLSPRRTTFAHHTQTGPGSSSIIVSHHPHLNQHLAPPIHSPMMGHSPVPFSHSQPPLESNILPPDSNFFDRVKRSLDSRDTYNEFLKVINLFTQGIIDSGRLVHESRNYLGDGELMVELIGILGWDERRERVFSGGMNGVMSGVGIGGGIVGGDDVWTRPTGVLDRPSRNQLHERYGSYRKLPASVRSSFSRVTSIR